MVVAVAPAGDQCSPARTTPCTGTAQAPQRHVAAAGVDDRLEVRVGPVVARLEDVHVVGTPPADRSHDDIEGRDAGAAVAQQVAPAHPLYVVWDPNEPLKSVPGIMCKSWPTLETSRP